jgi:RTX calcium-binding nonapeptide repeat (4 copies)
MAGSRRISTAGRARRVLTLLATAVFLLGLVVATDASLAAKRIGTKRADKISGTAGPDTIKGKGGKDKIKGKGGNDKLSGGKGKDKVIGGPGADKMMGGPGNDVINAADGKRDKAINGGPGKNRCVIDTALELAIARSCSTIVSGTPGGAGGPGTGTGSGLQLQSATGLTCGSQLPTCPFTLSGTGADATAGTVTGGGGVTGAGGGVETSGTSWSAGGLYGCTSDGFLRVTIGSKSVDVPVDCTV